MNESELLEQFLQALRQNPHALPPDGLDPELAEFARRLVQQTPSPSLNARRRMWERALAQSRVTSNGHLNHKELDTMAVITARPENLPRSNARFPLTLLAAAFAALLFIAIYMMMPKGTPNFSMLSAPVNQQQETATPIPSIVPTSTPSPANPASVSDFAPTGTPFTDGTVPMPDNGIVYAPVISVEAALGLAGVDISQVQNVELTYSINLNDGTIMQVHAQPLPAGRSAPEFVASLFPNAQVIALNELEGQGYTFIMNNGYTVYFEEMGTTIIYFTISGAMISSVGINPIIIDGTVPNVANPMQPTVPPPSDLQPSTGPNVIIVTATPITAIVVTATFVPTTVP